MKKDITFASDVGFPEKYLSCSVQKSLETFLLSRHLSMNSILFYFEEGHSVVSVNRATKPLDD